MDIADIASHFRRIDKSIVEFIIYHLNTLVNIERSIFFPHSSLYKFHEK